VTGEDAPTASGLDRTPENPLSLLDRERAQMEPQASRIVAQPQIEGTGRVMKVQLENRSTCLVSHRRRQDSAERRVGLAEPEDRPAVTEDSTAELLAL
jgi:hypothetical protein